MEWFRTRSVTALVAVAGLAAAAASQVQDSIPWRSADVASLAKLEAERPVDVLSQLAARPQATRIALRFDRPVTQDEREQLEAAGVRLLAPLGAYGFFASVAPGANAPAAVAAAPMRTATPVLSDWKLHPSLLDGGVPEWSVQAVADAFNPDISPVNPMIAAYVVVHRDVEPDDAHLIGDLAAMGVDVRDVIEPVHALVVELPRNLIDVLAADDRIQWIEPPTPPLGELNNENRALTQSNQAQESPYNLTGEGITVFVFDGGRVRNTHTFLAGRTTVIDGTSISNHATHVAGTVLGSGAAGGNHRGMAPGATLLSAGFQSSGGGIFLYTNPGDLINDYTTALNNGADISNNSIGTNTAANGFPCEITGEYGLTAATIDAIARGSLGESIVIFWAAGNERGVTRCGTGFGTTAPPGNHKNAISIGATNANNDTMTSFSSWGPANDGRIRPTLAAPGCQSNGDGGVTSSGSNSDTATSTLCGTSMASPTAAGVGALIYEDFRSIHGQSAIISNQLMKVFLIMGAVDLGNPGPDNQFGYGSIRAVNSIEFMRSGNWDEDAVSGTGAAVVYSAQVNPGQNLFEVTLAWDDVPGTPNVNPNLVNDLDLVVIDPNGTRHYPWTVNPANPGGAAVRNTVDRLNNIEQVTVNNPVAGTWRVEVLGYAVPEGPQTFAIGATNALASDFLALSTTSTVPTLAMPGEPVNVTASVTINNDTRVGPVTAFYRTAPGPFQSVTMTSLGNDQFEVNLPGALCGSTLDFYIQTEGQNAGIVTSPANGAVAPFSVPVGEVITWAHETFENDNGGWTGGIPSDTAVRGQWEWGIPEATIAQPGNVVTPGGQRCWVTGAAAGSSAGAFDVDEGETTLVTRVYDITGSVNPVLSYYRWYSNHAGASPFNDVFVIDISNNAGQTWQNLETIGPSGNEVQGGWIYAQFNLADVFPGQTLGQIQLRFIASDYNPQALVEALVDEFMIVEAVCTNPPGCSADITGPSLDGIPDGSVNAFDLNYYIALWVSDDPAADITGAALDGIPDGSVNAFDLNYYIGLWLDQSVNCTSN